METVTNYDDGRWQGHAAEYVSVHFKRTKHKSPSVELKVRMALASNSNKSKSQAPAQKIFKWPDGRHYK